MGRSPCCAKEGLKRGAWTATEDKILLSILRFMVKGNGETYPKEQLSSCLAGLERCGKSCSQRWLDYLRPDIKRGNITSDEEDLIIRLHKLLGNRWSLIAGRLPGRTDNEIKDYWKTKIQKKLHKDSKHKLKDSIADDVKERSSHDNHYKPTMSQSHTNSCLIRPKPTRCTKTVIIRDEDDELVAKAMVADPITCDSFFNGNKMEMGSNLFPSSEFMLDWDLDGSYLSDILNKCFLDMEDNNGNTIGSKSRLASSDDQALSLEDSKNVSDFQQIGTSIESDSVRF